MTMLKCDVAVIGAGPAGIAVAQAAAAAGLAVILADENPRIGGQISRLPFAGGPTTQETLLLEKVVFLDQAVCFGQGKHGTIWIQRNGKTFGIEAKATVLATGARERVFPISGWDRPGVMTAGAAQTLIKGSGHFPYQRVIVAGTGPLLLATAAQLLRAGVKVQAIVESAQPGPRNWRHALLTLSGGRILLQGLGYLATMVRHRVPIRFGTVVTAINRSGDERQDIASATVEQTRRAGKKMSGTTKRYECDAVLLSQGFSSSTELASQAGAELEWCHQSATWKPKRSRHFETSCVGLYAVGDCSGVGGAQLSALEGEMLGHHLAQLHGAIVGTNLDRRLKHLARRLRAVRRFRQGMDGIFPPPTTTPSPYPDSAIACRCEEVSVGDISQAISFGAGTSTGVKLWTRAGMGACQGRSCEHVVDSLLAEALPHVPRTPPRAQFPVRPTAGGLVQEIRLPLT